MSTPAATALGSFDQLSYRQRVLSTLKKAPSFSLDDPFFIVDLDPACDDTELYRARIAALTAFWNKERSPGYKALAAQLAKSRAALETVLLDPVERERSRRSVLTRRASTHAHNFSKLDELVAQLTDRYGGVPASRLPRLRVAAAGRGVSDADFDAWVTSHTIITEGQDASGPKLATAVRHDVRTSLDEYGQLVGDPAAAATLWGFLGLEPGVPDSAVAAAVRRRIDDNGVRPRDRHKTVTANLIELSRAHLSAAGVGAYRGALVDDAKDAITAFLTERSVLDGEITSTDADIAVRKLLALKYGLDTATCRQVVRDVATALGVPMSSGASDAIVVCPSCREPQSAKDGASCRYCDTKLFAKCPACRKRVEAAASSCPFCGERFAATRAARAALKEANTALAAGQLRAASGHANSAHQAAAPSVADELAALDTALTTEMDAANGLWRGVTADLAARRLYSATHRLVSLERRAADVPDHLGRTASEVLGPIRDRQRELDARTAEALKLPAAQLEAALEAVLADATDHPQAENALAALPLASPARVSAATRPEGVAVSWARVPGTSVSYRVVRNVLAPNGEVTEMLPITVTSATSAHDSAGAVGLIVSYNVTAICGRRSSAPMTTAPLLVVRDVSRATVSTHDTALVLGWHLEAHAGVVTIDRTVVEGPSAPLRRARGEAGVFRDAGASPGVTYEYHVYAEYVGPAGKSVRTTGVRVLGKLTLPLRPVRDLYAHTADGVTALSWARPPVGTVTVFASSSALGEPGAQADLAALASASRVVGSGARRCTDSVAHGAVVYTPVTVDGDRAVLGTALDHVAVPAFAALRVSDTGAELHVFLDWPVGVTEAVVVARCGAAPTGPDDAAGQFHRKVTNTALEISGGFVTVPAAPTGASMHVAVWPAYRLDGALRLASHPTRALARDATQTQVTYALRRTGLLRRTLTIDVQGNPVLPALRLIGVPGRTELTAERVADNSAVTLALIAAAVPPRASVEVPLNALTTPWTLRLVADEHADGVVVDGPTLYSRVIE